MPNKIHTIRAELGLPLQIVELIDEQEFHYSKIWIGVTTNGDLVILWRDDSEPKQPWFRYSYLNLTFDLDEYIENENKKT